MVKKILLSFVLVCFLISVVSAFDTDITIKTLADHKVSVFVYSTGGMTMIDSHHGVADSEGEVIFTHSSLKSKIDVLVKITKDGEKIFLEKFEDYRAGKPIGIRMDLDVIDGEYVEEVVEEPEEENVTEESAGEASAVTEEVSVEEEPAESGEGITGEVIAEDVGVGGKTWLIYVIVIGLLVVGAVVFLVGKTYATKRVNLRDGVNFPKKSNIPFVSGAVGKAQPSAPPQGAGDSEISKIEAQIKEAQDQLSRLRNEDKLKQAEAKLEADRRELEKLRKGI